MKKEILKLVFMIAGLTIGIIILSGKPLIKTFYTKPQISQQNFCLTSLSSSVRKDVYSVQELFVQVVEQVKPSVVNISTVYSYEIPQTEFFFGDPFEEFFKDFFEFDIPKQRQRPRSKPRQYRSEGGGSGVIISPDGYILTNEHVIKDATEIKVLLNIEDKNKEFIGKVIGRDARTDLAVIKINGKNLPYAKLGDSDNVRVGEWVLAIGSPFGLEQTITSGIVSARRQSINIEGRQYRDFIQTDAAINRGNSGGPLCNLNGEVIGINTAIYAPTGVFAGIGFAIPISRAKLILDDLIHKGKVTRGWLGIEIADVDDVMAKQFGLKTKQGVIINSVKKNTPAEKSGLKRGDIILEVKNKNKTVAINSSTDLQDTISSFNPKEKVDLKIFRDKKEQIVTVVLGEMPQDLTKFEEDTSAQESKEEKEFVWLGYRFVNIGKQQVEKFNLETDEGVFVLDIDYKSKNFENIGLRRYDVVISINQQKTKNVDVLKQILKGVNLKEGIVFDIIRDGRAVFLSFSK